LKSRGCPRFRCPFPPRLGSAHSLHLPLVRRVANQGVCAKVSWNILGRLLDVQKIALAAAVAATFTLSANAASHLSVTLVVRFHTAGEAAATWGVRRSSPEGMRRPDPRVWSASSRPALSQNGAFDTWSSPASARIRLECTDSQGNHTCVTPSSQQWRDSCNRRFARRMLTVRQFGLQRVRRGIECGRVEFAAEASNVSVSRVSAPRQRVAPRNAICR